MAWAVEYTDEFGAWWDSLDAAEQEDVAFAVRLLEERGPRLGYPYSSKIEASNHLHMRELHVQHRGRPYRVLYAFDPRRTAIPLIGGDKTGDDRWYDEHVPLADRLYDEHLAELAREDEGDDAMARKKNFRDLYETLPADARGRIETRVKQALTEMPLQELREARHLTQQQLAEHLKSGQAAVSKLERRTDMYVSTLRRFIEAMGGELEIVARFPDGDVRVTNFADDARQRGAA